MFCIVRVKSGARYWWRVAFAATNRATRGASCGVSDGCGATTLAAAGVGFGGVGIGGGGFGFGGAGAASASLDGCGSGGGCGGGGAAAAAAFVGASFGTGAPA